tara:strand:+ start:44 stop:244 length:201 start_codon:yes stop_codon:yes gene_type:complete
MKTKTVTKSIKLFSNSEALTGNAVANLNINDLSFNQYNVINKIVWDVCNQLENTPQLKKHKIKLND